MNIKIKRIVIVMLLIMMAAGVYNAPDLMRELKDKDVWATLQSVEAEQRGKPANNYIIIRKALGTKYDVLGVPTKRSNVPTAWMPLNEGEGVPVKILPKEEKLQLTCLDAERITMSASPDLKVAKLLRSECKEKVLP